MKQLLFRNLSKHYGKRLLFTDLEVPLTTGQCLLLTGKNGAGKTTLMRILAGLDKPDSGEIQVDQSRYTWRTYRPHLQRQILYLHQQPYLFEGSVWDNLAFALTRGLSRLEQTQQIEEVAAWAGLSALLNNKAKQLSGGEAQRLAMARALLRKPSALLLDEPTANMDHSARLLTLEMLEDLKHQGLMLMVASHDPDWFQAVTNQQIKL
ncbi:energy-coupling factor ABC transporter ATP-binding protein [uncultured Thiothrix sp.]|jgi:tungstate transport system ATP-binding protein|uniref:ABC transporter ATP-binding protein n=1 Tax=uncultured Thiothrix sp. TaxID=223185 RepID=UPI00261B622B|nr:energy-coupling factor ABC transporter ATP-binding protein [uncultured Thiothrix sp.]HMT93023.1 energy-coupling factor ABC transporter ATP-binding protein [Thiolinea sp.]